MGNLKMPLETQEHLREGLRRLGPEALIKASATFKAKGATFHRFCWDAYWAALYLHPFPRQDGDQREAMPYKGGINDIHIESFLRRELSHYWNTSNERNPA